MGQTHEITARTKTIERVNSITMLIAVGDLSCVSISFYRTDTIVSKQKNKCNENSDNIVITMCTCETSVCMSCLCSMHCGPCVISYWKTSVTHV